MGAIVSKIVVVGLIALFIYISAVFVDIACVDGLTFCQLYEPFSPW